MKAGMSLALLVAVGLASTALPAAQLVDAGTAALRVAQLEAEVRAAEDISAIKRLQRSYGYFVDKGMWTDLADYFTENAVANYPAGTFIGKASIREHLYRNVGNVPVGQVGLGDNRVYNHFSIQPVVHLDPGGQTAHGRWRVIAMFGSFGGGATWAEGIYEMRYARENGAWKIANLDYYSGFGAPYATGWAGTPPAAATPAPSASTSASGSAAAAPAPRRRQLAHAADRDRDASCEGFPAACIAPFHYVNPGKGSGAPVWTLPADLPAATGDLKQRTGLLLTRVQRLADEQQVENLQRVYGYYIDRAYWDQAADLFASNATLEVAQQGVYVGKQRIRAYLGKLGPHGLVKGWMNDHMQLQPVVTVSADGKRAWSRSRELTMTGHAGGSGQWSEGIYENRYVKEGGVWKIAALHFYPTFITDYDQGWGKDAQPAPGPLADLPPDRPPSSRYEIYPKAHVPPYHYLNPVTGRPVHYPTAGGPTALQATGALAQVGKFSAARVSNLSAAADDVATLVARVRSVYEIENLESAYGYYLDKNLYTDLADLFDPVQGSIELAHRGVYRGPKVREFLLKVFGRSGEGPVANRLGNHIQMQPVITLSADGRSAKIRQRMLQQMSQNGRASLGGAIYENEVVRGADGVWRFSKVNAWNTFSANYIGGWAKAAGSGMPGPNPELVVPDSPPTRQIAMFPAVYEIPYHYANPVTGRTELPRLVPIAQQLPDQRPAPPGPPAAVPPPAAPGSQALIAVPRPGMPPEIAAALREIGPKVEGPKNQALYALLHAAFRHDSVQVNRDLAYGADEKHRADVFVQKNAGGARRPLLVFVYGGGFRGGAKNSATLPFFDNIGYWAAEHGMVGVTINYRLAPQAAYPAGAEDIARLVLWLRSHAAEWGADPERIFLWGHSSGGSHVGEFLARTPRPQVAGAILMSGVYTAIPVWSAYFGDDATKYAERSSLERLYPLRLPMLVVWAGLDPVNFIPDSEKLLAGRRAAGTPTSSVFLPSHSHLSEAYAIGTADESLSAPLLQFIQSPPR